MLPTKDICIHVHEMYWNNIPITTNDAITLIMVPIAYRLIRYDYIIVVVMYKRPNRSAQKGCNQERSFYHLISMLKRWSYWLVHNEPFELECHNEQFIISCVCECLWCRITIFPSLSLALSLSLSWWSHSYRHRSHSLAYLGGGVCCNLPLSNCGGFTKNSASFMQYWYSQLKHTHWCRSSLNSLNAASLPPIDCLVCKQILSASGITTAAATTTTTAGAHCVHTDPLNIAHVLH